MLLKRYDNSLQTVVPNFDAKALNEISFVRDGAFSLPGDRFESLYEPVREEALTSEADAPVQKDAEEALLERLQEKIDRILDGLGEKELIVVENAIGVDWPKTRERRQDVLVDGENRFHFHWRVDPPLRLGIYRQTP